MSIFIESKTPNQCRSHHQKMMTKFGTIQTIIKDLIQKSQTSNESENKIEQEKIDSEMEKEKEISTVLS